MIGLYCTRIERKEPPYLWMRFATREAAEEAMKLYPDVIFVVKEGTTFPDRLEIKE